jgi:dihydrofolate reductase
MSLTRVHNFSISLDGFGTGEGQSHDAPFGHAGERLHDWMFATRFWRELVGQSGGTGGIDDAFAQQHGPGIGAEIMGAGKFGPPGWHEDPEWKGWWGSNPPFHTPTFILTHHPRPSIEMEGGTTFHFIDASPAEALKAAREAAGGQDVRIGGSHHDPRLPCRRAHRPPAHRGGPDPARPRRTPLGRTGGPREGLPGRGHLLAQRRHPRDVHPYRCLNRLGEADRTP